MTSPIAMSDDLAPSATPSAAELAAWAGLPRDEQIARMRRYFAEAACTEVGVSSPDEILRRARIRAGVVNE